MGLDAVGAWPPIRESHVEMDAAWALYEAWVAIQTGEVDSALVYGFGKSSPGDLHEIMTLQTDPYYVAPLWPSMVDMAALQARAYLEASGRDERRPRRGRGPRRSATRQANPHAVRNGRRDRRRRARRTGDARPAARRRHRADHRRHRRGRARGRRPRPLGVRAAGVDPRHRAPHRGARASACAISRRRRRPSSPASAAGVRDGAIDVAELHAQFSHEELILARGARPRTATRRSTRRAARSPSNPMMSAGLIRIGEVAPPHHRRATPAAASRTRRAARACNRTWSCVLEGDVDGRQPRRRRRRRADRSTAPRARTSRSPASCARPRSRRSKTRA